MRHGKVRRYCISMATGEQAALASTLETRIGTLDGTGLRLERPGDDGIVRTSRPFGVASGSQRQSRRVAG